MNNEFPNEEGFALESGAFMDVRLLEQLDAIKNLCVDYVDNPLPKNSAILADVSEAHIDSVRKALEKVSQETGLINYVDETLAIIKGLEINRVNFLNEIDGDDEEDGEKSYSVVEDDFERMREHLLDEDEECEETALDHAMEYYYMSFQSDIAQFSANCVNGYMEKPSTKRKAILRKVGFEALGVAKVTLGVVAGIAIAKKAKLL